MKLYAWEQGKGEYTFLTDNLDVYQFTSNGTLRSVGSIFKKEDIEYLDRSGTRIQLSSLPQNVTTELLLKFRGL